MRTNYPHHLPDFDYLGCHQYFLTFCVEARVHAFEDQDAIALVWTQFLRAAGDEAFSIIACCFMPDHVHLVVEGLEDNSDLKKFASRAKQLSGTTTRKVMARGSGSDIATNTFSGRRNRRARSSLTFWRIRFARASQRP
jgi:REP element-mobilizing transposase RayT